LIFLDCSFAEIRKTHFASHRSTAEENRAVIEEVRDDKRAPTWQNFVQPMVDASDACRVLGQVSHLNAVMNSPATQKSIIKISIDFQFYAELSQDLLLFEKFKQLRGSENSIN
jgi:oligopeptidase A